VAIVFIGACTQPAAAPNQSSSPPPAEPTAASPAAPTAAGTPLRGGASSPVVSPVAGAPIERAVLAKGERNSEPVEPTTTFRPNTKEIHLVGRVANAPRDTRLKVTWRAMDAPGNRGADVLAERELRIEGSRPFAFEFQPGQALAPGRYAAELAVNGSTAQTLAFSVVAPIPPVLARPENELPSLPGASQGPDPKPTNLQFIVDASGS